MQVSRVQSYQNSTGAVNNGQARSNNPFSLNASGGDEQEVQNRNKGNNADKNNAQSQLKQERVKQLQARLENENRDMEKLQAILSDQLKNLPQQDAGLMGEKMKSFQLAMGAKAGHIGLLQQAISQELSSGSIGGFVGQQAGGSGISFSVKA